VIDWLKTTEEAKVVDAPISHPTSFTGLPWQGLVPKSESDHLGNRTCIVTRADLRNVAFKGFPLRVRLGRHVFEAKNGSTPITNHKLHAIEQEQGVHKVLKKALQMDISTFLCRSI
jgi:hypothetical protein